VGVGVAVGVGVGVAEELAEGDFEGPTVCDPLGATD